MAESETMKRFVDIPQVTHASYSIDCSLVDLPSTIDSYIQQAPHLDMNPDFQRAHVWRQTQRTRYVEFVLSGGKASRDIYFNCPGWQDTWKGPFQIVDGKQRIDACLRFMAGRVAIFDGMRRNDFLGRPLRATLRFHINNLPTRREVLQWYLDINCGGVVHTTSELDKVRAMLKATQSKGPSDD